MQWTKVSVKHAELTFSDASDSVFRTYVRLMLLTSSMEVAPTYEQTCIKLGKRKMESLVSYLKNKELSLSHIIYKVMEDVESVLKQRENGKQRQQKHRVTRDITPQEEIRLDKSREKIKNSQHQSTNKNKNIHNTKAITHPPHISLSKEDYKTLVDKFGSTTIKLYIDKINDYISANKSKNPYKDFSAVIRNWLRKDNVKAIAKPSAMPDEKERFGFVPNAEAVLKGLTKKVTKGIGNETLNKKI